MDLFYFLLILNESMFTYCVIYVKGKDKKEVNTYMILRCGFVATYFYVWFFWFVV
jgi:hypothetical protein